MQITTAQQIPLTQIKVSSDWNLHPFLDLESTDNLIGSIQSLGLLHPLIVQKKASDTFELLCGRFRLQALLSCSDIEEDIAVLVLSNTCSIQETLHIILAEQLLSAPLSLMEQAFFFKYCLQHLTLKKTAEYFLPILDKKPQPHIIERLLPLLKLEAPLQKSIHQGRVGEKTAFELLKLSAKDRETLHKLIRKFELGGGKQKRLLSLTKELAAREQCSITEILTEENYSAILAHQEMNNPQKLGAIFSLLQNSLFPESIEAEKSFQQAVRNLKLPPELSVSHSDAFEKDEVTLAIRFPELNSLTDSLDTIKGAISETND